MRFGDTVTVLRRGGRDRHGDHAGFTESHTITGVGVDWTGTGSAASLEPAGELRETVVIDAVLFLPYGADLLATDQVELPDGLVYRVVGKPMPARNPLTGRAFGIEARVQRVGL